MKNLGTPLNEAEMERLDEILLDRIDDDENTDGKDEGILNISELDGFFTALVSGPNVIPPSCWMPAVWGDFDPVWESMEQFQQAMTLMMRHMNGIAGMLIEDPENFEPLFMRREIGVNTFRIVDAWCEGYLRGIRLDHGSWSEAEEVEQLLGTMLLFTSEEGWQKLERMTLDEVNRLQDNIAPVVRRMHAYWLARRKSALEQMAEFGGSLAGRTVRHDAPKVGRNDPCPCGSGKKFKKCCGAAPAIH